MKSNLIKNNLLIFILILFILLSVIPMDISIKSDKIIKDSTLAKELINLAFFCRKSNGLEHYKQQLIDQLSTEDNYKDVIEENENIIINIQAESTPLSYDSINSPWPMSCHDLRHTSQSPYSTINNPGEEKWRFRCDWVEGGSVIGSDGTIYFGDFDHYLYAMFPNGTLKWKYKLADWIWSTPTIDDDGTVYVCCWGCYLYTINSNGTLKWRFSSNGPIGSSPAVGDDGTIYFGNLGNNIYAVNPNGTEKWHYTTGYSIASSPAVGDDGTIYIGSGDSYLYALYPNGTLRWRFPTGGEIHSNPSIAQDGTIYFGSNDGYLYAIYSNGTMKWRFGVSFGIYGNPSLGEDGTIYVGTDKLYAIKPDGTLKWSFNLGSYRWIGLSSPAISADRAIYVGLCIGNDAGGEIVAVNSDGIEKWRVWLADYHVSSSPSIAEDGSVYIGSSYNMSGGYLYAFNNLEPNAPSAPTINGPTSGKADKEYEYTFKSTSPTGNDVYYYIDWGDGKWTDWIGPYSSGEIANAVHSWKNDGNYTIRARAKDTDNLWGPWGEFEISIPRNRVSYSSLFLRFLEQFPDVFTGFTLKFNSTPLFNILHLYSKTT